jgi:multiple sugar transport system substrate-binding protein/raffinose/stachyose/melibiose transport system substrate-binding protein
VEKKMKKIVWYLLTLTLLGAFILSACGSAAPATAAPQEPKATEAPKATDIPATQAPAAEKQVVVVHYFSDTLGKKTVTDIFNNFTTASGIKVVDNTTGHEDFKTQILVMLAGDNPPDAFSYWAGARVQFVVDSDGLQPIDDLWAANKLDSVIPPALAAQATVYNGKHYLIPFGYHYAGLFYNPKVMKTAGITEFPTTWDGLLTMCETLKAKGVTPFALGSKDRWPAQFWFDYILLRTAGPEYRAKLMAGQASYTDPEVVTAMEMWKVLVDKGYFVENANAYTWTDAADQVANGKAAMTLMGTWITGYWNGNNLKPVDDYDFFPFPTITEGVPNAVVGPVDGWVMSKGAKDKEAAAQLMAFLVTDPASSAAWALGQGALSPNMNVDSSIYTPVMKKASEVVAKAEVFAFNYDLATTPPMAEGGLNMFAQFMDNPANFLDYLKSTEDVAKGVFKK